MKYKGKDIKCPNCNSKIYFCLDEWGHTPIHLHCNKCDINIGATSSKDCVELLQDYHKNKTYIEFYNNKIQLRYEKGKLIENNE